MATAYQAPTQSAGLIRLPTDQLNKKHPDWTKRERFWNDIDLLYEGGDQLRQNASRFLLRKAKELPEVYSARLEKFTYQNILGSGVDYYSAAMFQTEPEIDAREIMDDGTREHTQLEGEEKIFWDGFRTNCDRKQTTLTDFQRDVLRHLLLYRCSWILIDLPRADTRPLTLAEQQAGGMLDPYIVGYEPRDVINWCVDDQGELEWAVVHTKQSKQQFRGEPVEVERWYYFDRTNFEVWEATAQGNSSTLSIETNSQQKRMATQVASGQHALAECEKVPLIRVEVTEGMWLANRVFPQVLTHLNQENAYDWALWQSNLCMPVIIGGVKAPPTLSEAGFIQLPENCQIAWTEPPGASFERSEARVMMLREEIYRQFYLMASGRSSEATPAMQSGYSKEMDMVPATHIQNYFGDKIRVTMEKVLNLVAKIRDEPYEFDVRGFTFLEKPTIEEMQIAQLFSSLQIPSDTAEKENFKKAIRVRFQDMNDAVINQMCQEIDDAPSAEDRALLQQQTQQDLMAQNMQQDANTAVNGPAGQPAKRPAGQPAKRPVGQPNGNGKGGQ